MNRNAREVIERTQFQGVDESICYTVTTTPWGSAPADVSFKVFLQVSQSQPSYADVTASVAPGEASADGDVITLPAIGNLAEGATYRVEVKFSAGGNVYECYFYIDAQR
jgi:hypothetical protein